MLDITARDTKQLSQIAGEIHDWFFDLEDVRHDTERRQVVIPFRRWDYGEARELPQAPRSWPGRVYRRATRNVLWEAPFYRWYLQIGHVRSLEIEDEDDVGTADFVGIDFEAETRALTIECSYPVTLRLNVDDLSVRLTETREFLGMAQYMTSGDPEWATGYSGEVLPGRPS